MISYGEVVREALERLDRQPDGKKICIFRERKWRGRWSVHWLLLDERNQPCLERAGTPVGGCVRGGSLDNTFSGFFADHDLIVLE